MADNSVFITGAASGALSDALHGLPEWATEKTLKAIEGTLKKSLKISDQLLSKLGGGSNGGLSAKDISELDKVIAELTADAKKKRKEDLDNQKETKNWWDKEAKQNKRVQSGLEKYIPTIASLYTINAKVVGAMEDNLHTYAQLQQAGINVVAGFDNASSGFTALQQLTATTGVRFTELAGTMVKYSTSVNAFTAGKFADTVKNSKEALQDFGFTSKESAELLASYLESQSGFTDATNKSSEESSAQLKTFAKGVNRASMVTGMAKTAILANIEAISKSNEASILSANVGQDAANATLTFVASMKDQNLGKAFLRMMTDQIKPLNDTFMNLQKIGLGSFGQKLMNFTQSISGLSAEAKAQAMKSFEAQNHAEIEHGKQQANLFRQIPELAASAEADLTLLNGIQQQARTTREMSEAELRKMEKSNKARSQIASQWETLMSKLQMTFSTPIWLLEKLGNGLEYLNKGIDAVVNTINYFDDETTGWIGVIGIVLASFKLLSPAASILGFAFRMLGSVLGGSVTGIMAGVRYMGSVFGMIGNTVKALAEPLMAGVRYIGGILGSVGGMVLKLAGVIGWLYTAFEAGYAIGTYIYDLVKDFKWFTDMMDTIFHGLDKVLQYIPGSVGSDAKDRIASAEKLDKLSLPAQQEISVPKNPAPSTINSPSAVPAPPVSQSTSNQVATNSPSTSTSPDASKTSITADINKTLAEHTNILAQMLIVLESNVSVNKDILKYARNSA